MTYQEMADQLGVPFCPGGCGITTRSHDQGFLFFGVLHFTDRRFTRRGAKNFLMQVAYRARHIDEFWLNDPRFDWMYLHNDSVMAQKFAGKLGFRIPASLFDEERERCILLARKRGIKLSRYPEVYAWAKR